MWETFYRVFKQLPVRIETWAGVNSGVVMLTVCVPADVRSNSKQTHMDVRGRP